LFDLFYLINILAIYPVVSKAYSMLMYNYTNLDQLHISPVNSTHRVLQKISLHHHSFLFASTKKSTL